MASSLRRCFSIKGERETWLPEREVSSEGVSGWKGFRLICASTILWREESWGRGKKSENRGVRDT